MKLLADEGFNGNFVRELRKSGFEVDWILETHPGIMDDQVIEIAKSNKQIVLTEDKDFGEWVFAHQIRGLTLVFIRYRADEIQEIIENLVLILRELEADPTRAGKFEFITINKNKIRRRRI